MKNLKIILLLLSVSLLSACSQNTSESLVDCKDSFPAAERVGIASATKLVARTITLYFTKIVKDEKVDRSSCNMICSSPQYTKVKLEAKKYASENPTLISLLQVTSDRELCVPVQRACPAGGFTPFLGLDLSRVFEGMELSSLNYPSSEPLTGFDAAVYGSCPEGPGGPEGCLPDYVLNTETNSCVQQEMSCTEEELDSIGAETGYKQFNTMTNEYDLCQAETCQPGYSLALGICNPDLGGDPILGCTDGGATNYDPAATEDDGSCTYDMEIYGCMDSRADNYDPSATQDDMSCMCNPPKMPWNPITGCEEAP